MHGTTKRSMAECNLDLPSDKLCKYSYMSWCPTCDRESPRRRTKSETHEACRKKTREMKTFSPKKYDRRREYENHLEQELDCDIHDMRYERVRSNLCELPTTYISNNCQLNLTHTKLAAAPDYLDAKLPRDYENSYVLSRDCSPPPIRCEGHAKRAALQQPHKRPTPLPCNGAALSHLDAPPAESVYSTPIHQAQPHRAPHNHLERHVLDVHAPVPDTGTFFDMNFDPKQVRERYARELETLRAKLRDLNHHKYQPMGPPARVKNLDSATPRRHTTNVKLEDIRVIEDVLEPKIDGRYKHKEVPDASAALRRPLRAGKDARSSTKISIKATKARFTGGRQPKLKLRAFKINSVLMEDDSTTESEIEELLYPNKKRVQRPASPVHELPLAPAPKAATPSKGEFGDAPIWPVRYSLFPHIPPYLQFSMHDAAANKLPAGRRYLKWKLSTITPIVVRKTLLNTGFRLVRIPPVSQPSDKIKSTTYAQFCENADKFELVMNCINEQSPISSAFPESNDWAGTWGKQMKSPMFKTLKNNQKLNHFAGTFQLGRKDRLWKNVQRLMLRFGVKEFDFIPQTFILPHDIKSLKQCWECKDGSAGEKWIVKPPASARGVGIKVINKWSQLPRQNTMVVQKYISDPYLINGSKFDLRLYVLVTSFNPLRIYLYPEGLVRFASVKYSDNDRDLKDRFMHLTNYSINKMSSQYTANEDANSCQGHKWTLTKLWDYLSDFRVDTERLWLSLKELVIKTILSGESPITQLCKENVCNRYNCYELFGIDVLFDNKLKPWLLEVNISPSLHSASPLDLHVKGPLVQTLFNLAQFHLPPKISRCNELTPPCYDPRLYTTALTPEEANKHNYYMQIEEREDYLCDILENLTGDDVRFLTQAEDERVVQGNFERIFPTAETFKYLEFLPVRYYNRLFDAWETRYEHNRAGGIELLKALCATRIHLKVQPPRTTAKNSPNTTHGAAASTMSTEDQPQPETPNVQKTESVTSAHGKIN